MIIIKKIIALFLSVLMLNINFAYAQNLVTVTAENGKSADLDLDSIQMAVDTVEYDIITEVNDYVYINKMSTELYREGTPTAVVERKKYKGSISEDQPAEIEKIKNREYRSLKSGTLQAEIFDVLSKELGKRNFTKGKSTWKKYLKRQRKQIYKSWTPHKNLWEKNYEIITPVKYNNVSLTVNKDGTIKERINDHGLLTYLEQLDALPDDYTAETFQLDVKMNYYKYAGAKMHTPKPLVKQISPVHSEVTIAKNQRPPVIGHIQYGLLWSFNKVNDFGDWIDGDLAYAPLLMWLVFTPVACLSCIGAWIVVGIMCVLSGVSIDDMP